MVFHMKKAMTGTFFERWLTMGGWSSTTHESDSTEKNPTTLKRKREDDASHSDESMEMKQV